VGQVPRGTDSSVGGVVDSCVVAEAGGIHFSRRKKKGGCSSSRKMRSRHPKGKSRFRIFREKGGKEGGGGGGKREPF